MEKLIDIRVDSLKIEGRTKSFYYVSKNMVTVRPSTTHFERKPYNPQLAVELESLGNRGYTEGFLVRHPHGDYQNYEQGQFILYRQSEFVR